MTQNPSEDRTPRYGEQDPQHTHALPPQNPYGQGQDGQGQQAPHPPQNAYGQNQAGPQYGQGQYGQGQYDAAGQYPGGAGASPYGGTMPSYQGQAYQGQVPAQAAGPAPQAVRRGALLVYIACGLGVVGAVLLALPALQEEPATAIGSILGSLVVFALGIAGAVLTVKGFNWARITSLVFACLSVVRLLVGMFGLIALFTDPLLGIGYLFQVVSTLLYILGVVFFWLTSSTLWFRSRQPTLY